MGNVVTRDSVVVNPRLSRSPMSQYKAFKIALLFGASLAGISACDTDSNHVPPSESVLEASIEFESDSEAHWNLVPLPQPPGVNRFDSPAASVPATFPWTVETFQFSADDFIAVTSAPGGLFAPVPSGITSLPPELADGFLIATTFRDETDTVIGFGTEQEVLDLANEEGLTTYTITIPGRGTLMLRQRETLSWLLGEFTDMFANEEFVREYDPVYVQINTIPGTGWIVGGTGEFAGSMGVFREVGWLRELNLLTGQHDLGVTLQVLFFF